MTALTSLTVLDANHDVNNVNPVNKFPPASDSATHDDETRTAYFDRT
ncbi:hypothetical protein SH449x_002909 [Pirellulaceae bacterium SH449]